MEVDKLNLQEIENQATEIYKQVLEILVSLEKVLDGIGVDATSIVVEFRVGKPVVQLL